MARAEAEVAQNLAEEKIAAIRTEANKLRDAQTIAKKAQQLARCKQKKSRRESGRSSQLATT